MAELKHTSDELKQWQALPLDIKTRMTQERIRQWVREFGEDDVAISFSGGKDSTVLLDIVRKMYPSVKAVFSNTGLEYPEIQMFVRQHENVDIVVPKMKFPEVLTKYGYPIIGKETSNDIWFARKIQGAGREFRSAVDARRILTGDYHEKFAREEFLPIAQEVPVLTSEYCCYHMKKQPIKKWQHDNASAPIIATMAEESLRRRTNWLQYGCNIYEGEKKKSQPMSFWTEQDVLQYIVENGLKICSVYGDIVTTDRDGMEYIATPITAGCGNLKCTGCKRTGCIFCAYGFHSEKGETRFQKLAKTHPKQYAYALDGGQWIDNPYYDPTAPKMDGNWKNWNPKKIWVPSKEGLGMKKVFDMCNEVMGKNFYRYD